MATEIGRYILRTVDNRCDDTADDICDSRATSELVDMKDGKRLGKFCTKHAFRNLARVEKGA